MTFRDRNRHRERERERESLIDLACFALLCFVYVWSYNDTHARNKHDHISIRSGHGALSSLIVESL